jgi:hypothetical protein
MKGIWSGLFGVHERKSRDWFVKQKNRKGERHFHDMESANEFTDRIALGIEEAKAALTKVKDEYTMYYNRRREPALVFAPGYRVWLDGSDIATN